MSKKILAAALASTLVAAVVIVALVVLLRSGGTNANSPANEPMVPPPVNGPTEPPPRPPSTINGNSDIIHVWEPQPGETVSSPLTTTGEARGNWYFEASFPIKLLDGNGKVIAEHYAEAQGEWMTADYVPFKGALEFDVPDTAEGTLVLQKDNPSGLPEHDDEIRVPVRFNKKAPLTSLKPCVRTGCSGQICSDEEVITTCEYRTEYACYKTAKCERQTGGACGWTLTPELLKCAGAI